MSQKVEKSWERLMAMPKKTLEQLFETDAERLDMLTGRIDWPSENGTAGIYFDWSKTHLDLSIIHEFEIIASEMGFAEKREKLFSGGQVNVTEQRSATHTAMRGMGSETDIEEAHSLLARMGLLVDAIKEGVLGEISHIIHIGIGGSALGPALAIDALCRDLSLFDVHVVSNIDGAALEEAFKKCDPSKTLVAVASKTFTTTETMTNAISALKWLQENDVSDPYGRVVALTASPENAVAWGIDETRVLPFPNSVGGRYSLWSSIGFPLALSIGMDEFTKMLDGASVVDKHFLQNEGASNLCLRAAFSDQYYARIMGSQTRACFVYDERLRLFPSYLQQLEMESNGKRVKLDGSPVTGPTAPITWGGVGTDAQHAVFQLLHQGTHIIPTDFVACIMSGDALDPSHHEILLANCFAQSAALMTGGQMSSGGKDPAREFPGNRPSASILCDDLSAETLGALIAFHEHRVFANAVLMEVNPFDQFGVELGKKMAIDIQSGISDFDVSTQALLEKAGLVDRSI